MAAEWYMRIGGAQLGPFSAAKLRQLTQERKIKRDTLVKKGEDGEWVRASDVNGLFEVGPPVPPPITQEAVDREAAPRQAAACPHCGQRVVWSRQATAGVFACPRCGGEFQMPSTHTPAERTSSGQSSTTKTCPFCAEEIATRAIKCKHCGSMLRSPDSPFQQVNMQSYEQRPEGSTTAVTVPVLISAIANIVVGLIWLSTCFGVILAIPMFVLCIFEFTLYAKADRLDRATLARQATSLGVFEILIGLANTVTLICGIIALIKASKLSRHRWSF